MEGLKRRVLLKLPQLRDDVGINRPIEQPRAQLALRQVPGVSVLRLFGFFYFFDDLFDSHRRVDRLQADLAAHLLRRAPRQ